MKGPLKAGVLYKGEGLLLLPIDMKAMLYLLYRGQEWIIASQAPFKILGKDAGAWNGFLADFEPAVSSDYESHPLLIALFNMQGLKRE
jgi:hypothetical protein